jgi:hypothetical protein
MTSMPTRAAVKGAQNINAQRGGSTLLDYVVSTHNLITYDAGPRTSKHTLLDLLFLVGCRGYTLHISL